MTELNSHEKAELVAVADRQADDYDRKFYEAMGATDVPLPDSLDEKIRRAIHRFTFERWGKGDMGAAAMTGFIHGYMVGRKLRNDIRRKK